jgi:site-specific recombinase XerD
VPTLAAFITDYLAQLAPNTRRTYATHVERFRDGIGPVCDQICEPCLEPPVWGVGPNGTTTILGEGYLCRCDCAACRASRIVAPRLADEQVSAAVCSRQHAEKIAVIARRMAIKKGIVENRRRAQRGKPAKAADGFGAEENAIGALRSLYEHTKVWCGSENALTGRKKPRRNSRERRPLEDFEMADLHHTTQMGGDDPELDTLLLDFGIATGARREGAYALTVGQVHLEEQVVVLRDKFKRSQPAPVSRDLVERLLSHARRRGGPDCDPSSPSFRSDAPVFHYKDGSRLTDRRFDTLSGRWQRDLPWANTEQLGYHHIRHTMAAIISVKFGTQYKKRYLRHADGNVTDGYGVCTFEELTRAMSTLLDFEHPLVHGLDERRRETLRRLGLSDDD